ncbi:hypothetical protein [Paraburkholderia lacunae]|uniref:hypothetical protein n=1 Tax=Paraburkholderia lacunae TaxID=2211104 RepID=UPI001058ADD7|nr:hypothetical protein [Paraburkholderia lacunae]
MTVRIPVSDDDIAREFRLRHLRGSAVDAVTNPALRICLANCAELRKKQKRTDQPTSDGKRLAAGDTE